MKRILIVLLSLVLCFGTVGCRMGLANSLKETEQEVNAKLDKDYTAEIQIGVSLAQADNVDNLIKAFNVHYPNIKVKPRIQSDEQTVLTWTQAELSKRGTTPDILYFTSSTYLAFASGEVLKDLNPYLEDSYEKGVLEKDDLNDDILSLGRTNNKEGVETAYLMPTHYDQVVTLFNTAQFKDAKIEIRNEGTADMTFCYTPIDGENAGTFREVKANDWTWDDFMEICALLKKNYDDKGLTSQGKSVATMSIGWDATMFPIMEAFGGQIIDDEGNLVLEEEGNIEKVAASLKMQWDVMNVLHYSKYSDQQSLSTKNTAIQFQSRPAIVGWNDEASPLYGEFDVAPFPAINETDPASPKMGGGSHGYAMYRFSRDPNAAWAFMQFMFTEEGQQILGKSGSQVPVLKHMLTEVDDNGEVWEWRKAFPDINNDAFILYTDRFTPVDFMNSLPQSQQAKVYEAACTGFTSILSKEEEPDYEAELKKLNTDIQYIMEHN